MNRLLRWTAAGLVTLAFFGCAEPRDQGGDTQTNWLKECTTNADCGSLSCHCGLCTRTCNADLACDGAPVGVACRARDSVETLAQCGAATSEGLCLGPSVAPTSTVESFCEDYFGALCKHVADCGCSAEASMNCASSTTLCAEPNNAFAILEADAAAGHLVFDAVAASALVARIQNPATTCLDQILAAGFDSYSARTFGSVFLGTRRAGAPCHRVDGKKNAFASVCEPGLMCVTGTDGANTCVALAAPGEACPVLPENATSTCLERKAPDKDGEFESAFASLTCVPTSPGSAAGTCRTAAPDGSPCDDARQCAGGRCASALTGEAPTCGPKLANGSSCELGEECESGRCATPIRTCESRLSDGSECTAAVDCESGACNGRDDPGVLGTCGPPVVPPEPLPKGSACVWHEDCGSMLVCDVGFCGERLCQDFSN
jgi:hypothetical protein